LPDNHLSRISGPALFQGVVQKYEGQSLYCLNAGRFNNDMKVKFGTKIDLGGSQ